MVKYRSKCSSCSKQKRRSSGEEEKLNRDLDRLEDAIKELSRDDGQKKLDDLIKELSIRDKGQYIERHSTKQNHPNERKADSVRAHTTTEVVRCFCKKIILQKDGKKH